MEKVKKIVYSLTRKNIRIDLDETGERIKISGEVQLLSEEDKSNISSYRNDIMALLKARESTREGRHQKIETLPLSENYALSDAQNKLWTLSQFKEGSATYNMPFNLELIGECNTSNLSRAIKATIQKHEILRTVFKENQHNEIRQWILPADEIDFKLKYIDFSYEEGKESKIKEYLKKDFYKPFALDKGPLFRASLLKLADSNYIFYYNLHHIICDGWSMGVLAKEIFSFYESYNNGKNPEISELRIQYKEYAAWHLDQLNNDELKEQREFWTKNISGELPLLNLPSSKIRPAFKTFNGDRLSSFISPENTAKLKEYGKSKGSSLYISLLTICKVLIHKYTAMEDIIIGCPVAGREHVDLEEQIGFYVNTIPLRNKVNGSENFNELYHKIKESTLEALKYQSYPIEKMFENLSTKRDFSRNPIFDMVIALQNADNHIETSSLGFKEGITDIEISKAKFDLEINFQEDGNHINYQMTYNTDVYERDMIERFMEHFDHLISQVLINPEQELNKIKISSNEEETKILNNFCITEETPLEEKSILDLFNESVENFPDKTAVVFEDKKLTYKELNVFSNQFAHYLKEKYKVEKNDFIAIKLERDELFIVAVLAVLKLDGIYVPLDVGYPQERITYIEEETKCKISIDGDEVLEFLGCREKYGITNLNSTSHLQDVAYVMFTSGSTGKPKGVIVEQQSIVRLVKNTNYISTSSENKVLGLSNFAFDGSTFDIFLPLLNGGTLVISDKDIFLDLYKLNTLIYAQSINCFFITTALFNCLVDEELEALSQLDCILMGGEKASVGHVSKFVERYPKVDLLNVYGPTENTTFSTFNLIKEIKENQNSIPIGRPISNTSCHILDGEGVPCAIGVVGELWLGGAGVSRGYLNLPELTRERFRCLEGGGRLYGTGDLARWLPSGDIEFLGRSDDQVKVRGHRIELGGISKVLTDLPEVMESVVVQGEDGDLVGYVVLKEGRSTDGLRASLLGQLPEYMVPLHYVSLTSIPLTGNGKVDKGSLPAPDRSMGKDRGTVPSEGMELAVAEIWESVLGVRGVCLGDDFFELGGHSLKATRLLSEYHRSFDVRLGLRELFSRSTLSQHVSMLEEGLKSCHERIPLAPEKTCYPLSDAQRRLWLLFQMDPGSVAYNMPSSFELSLGENPELLVSAVEHVIDRYEILRTIFREDSEGEVRQWILSKEELGFELSRRDFSGDTDPMASLREYMGSDSREPFDLERGPLLRASLLKLSAERYVFYYNMHHIIGDGWSMGVLSETIDAYRRAISEGSPLPPPPRIQYKDYSYWQLSELEGGAFSEHREYWLTLFEGGNVPLLDLPTEKVRPAVKTYSGKSLGTYIGPRATSSLRDYCTSRGGTLFMGLLSVLDVLLYKYTSVRDLTVGTPVSGREHTDLSDQIGFYVNTLALRNEIVPGDSFSTFFERVKECTLGSYTHGAYPFDRLVEDLDLTRDRSRSPLFDIMMTLQNNGERRDMGSFSPEGENGILESSIAGSKFDMSITFEEVGDQLSFYATYNNDVYDREMVEGLMGHYKVLLDSLLASPGSDLREVGCIGGEETLLLEGFNATSMDLPARTVVDLLASSVGRYPDKIAARMGTGALTYSELWERSGRLANHLSSLGSGRGDIVAICMERSLDYIISVLGVMRSGGAYLPIDPEYPLERREFMLSDSGSRHVLVDSGFSGLYADSEALAVEVGSETYLDSPGAVSLDPPSPGDLLYVIYTSGSTGRPKGVEVLHGALASRLAFYRDHYDLGPDDNVLFYRSFSFDGSIEEYLLPLTVGGLCVVAPPDFREDLFHNMVGHIEEHSVSKVNMPPLLLQNILEELGNDDLCRLESLRHVVSGGDKINVRTVNRFHRNLGRPYGISLYNSYGPTENTIDSTIYRFDGDREYSKISIGSPVGDSQVYVLDGDGQLCPIGVRGEICVSGSGLARGYLNRPGLTGERFVAHPFREGELMYKTGDHGRWSREGTVEFLGRMDDQVKIRGHRIELGEIEHALLKQEKIQEAYVDIKTVENDKLIVAYLSGTTSDMDKNEIREILKETLPDYMLPNHMIILERLPMTINGKIDKKNLPEITEINFFENEYVAASNDMESELIEIWEEVLNKKGIGVVHNFFDLGGHSLKAMNLVNQVNKKYNLEMKIIDLFEHATVESLAKWAHDKQQSREEGKEYKELII